MSSIKSQIIDGIGHDEQRRRDLPKGGKWSACSILLDNLAPCLAVENYFDQSITHLFTKGPGSVVVNANGILCPGSASISQEGQHLYIVFADNHDIRDKTIPYDRAAPKFLRLNPHCLMQLVVAQAKVLIYSLTILREDPVVVCREGAEVALLLDPGVAEGVPLNKHNWDEVWLNSLDLTVDRSIFRALSGSWIVTDELQIEVSDGGLVDLGVEDSNCPLRTLRANIWSGRLCLHNKRRTSPRTFFKDVHLTKVARLFLNGVGINSAEQAYSPWYATSPEPADLYSVKVASAI